MRRTSLLCENLPLISAVARRSTAIKRRSGRVLMCAASVCAVALVAAVQAHYAAADTTISSNPQGDWVGTYGGSGYDLAGWSGGDEVLLTGVSVGRVEDGSYQWGAPAADQRA